MCCAPYPAVGSVYTGNHSNDLACGVGRLRQPASGTKNPNAVGGEWVGVFDKGYRHGPGRQEDASGAVTEGTWWGSDTKPDKTN
jgi:hypothetical protein